VSSGDSSLSDDPLRQNTAMTAAQYALSHPYGMERSYWHRARNAILWRRIKGLCADHPTVLDIGCGPGIVVDFLKARGVDCHGVDLGFPHLIHPDLEPAIHRSVSAFDLPLQLRERVQILLLMDVLEHLPDPAGFLSKCQGAFPKVTHVFVTLPARAELWSNYDDYYGHFRRYSLKDVPSLITGTSFKLLDSGYFFAGLYVAMRVLSWLRPARPIGFATPRFDPAQKLIGTYFDLEQQCLPKRVWGSSLYVLLERRVS